MKIVIKLFLFLTVIEIISAPTCYADDASSVAVKTAIIIKKPIGEILKAYGTLQPDPDQVISLSLPHAGLINRVWVRLGQRVKSGDKLLKVITAPDSRMQYLQAQSAVDFSERELKRTQRLLKEQLTTQAKVDASRKNLRDANTTLEALHKRGLNLSKETLRAPMDGIITQLDVAQGQRVQANTTAMLIAAEKRLIARLGVEAEELVNLNSATPVTLTSVFVANVKVESHIRDVHAMINPSTHLVEVLVPIPQNQVEHLVLGSRVLGHIHLPEHQALIVPRSAVLGDKNNVFVFIIKKNKAYKIKVKTGFENNNEIEISGAVNAGDVVVTLGNYELDNGVTIREIRQ